MLPPLRTSIATTPLERLQVATTRSPPAAPSPATSTPSPPSTSTSTAANGACGDASLRVSVVTSPTPVRESWTNPGATTWNGR